MPQFLSPYATTAANALLNPSIQSSIKEAFIRDNIDQKELFFDNDISDETSLITITGKYPSESNIPFFAHPIEVKVNDIRRNDNKIYLVADARQLVMVTKDNNREEQVYLRNRLDFDILKIRMALLRNWYENDSRVIRDISHIPASVYSNWIAESVANRFYLDPKDQLSLAIISCFFYNLLFISSDEIPEADRFKMIKSVQKCTGALDNHVIEIMDKLTPMKDIRDFCKNVINILENSRIADFNPGLLVTIISTSWFGLNSKELLSCALEHPPTWVAIVYASYIERSFKNSKIAKISERYAREKGQNDFTKALILLVKDSLVNK